jgi:hypothetical protein
MTDAPRLERTAAAPARKKAKPAPVESPPRCPSFPCASPLSEEERLLVLYVSRTPEDEMAARSGFLDTPAPLPALPDADPSS